MVIHKTIGSQYNAEYSAVVSEDAVEFTLSFQGMKTSVVFNKTIPVVVAKYVVLAITHETLVLLRDLETMPAEHLHTLEQQHKMLNILGAEYWALVCKSPAVQKVLNEQLAKLHDLAHTFLSDIADVASIAYPTADHNKVYVTIHSLVAKELEEFKQHLPPLTEEVPHGATIH